MLGFCWRVQCCWVSVVTLGFFFFFFFFFLIWVFVSVGFWWAVGSGQWWRGGHGGGAVIEVEGRWRRKLRKKEKYILLCRYIILMNRIGK